MAARAPVWVWGLANRWSPDAMTVKCRRVHWPSCEAKIINKMPPTDWDHKDRPLYRTEFGGLVDRGYAGEHAGEHASGAYSPKVTSEAQPALAISNYQ